MCPDGVAPGWLVEAAEVILTAPTTAEHDVVLLHDPRRPPAGPGAVAALVAAVRAGAPAAVAVAAVSDTVKRVDASGRIMSTVDRDTLRSLRSPYAVATSLLPTVWGDPESLFTSGIEVTTVDGES